MFYFHMIIQASFYCHLFQARYLRLHVGPTSSLAIPEEDVWNHMKCVIVAMIVMTVQMKSVVVSYNDPCAVSWFVRIKNNV